MSDTVKLIIEIDPHIIYAIQNNTGLTLGQQIDICNAIKNGIPLDDVKADMEKAKHFHIGTFENDNPIDNGIVEGFDKAIAILDNIGKTESEEV